MWKITICLKRNKIGNLENDVLLMTETQKQNDFMEYSVLSETIFKIKILFLFSITVFDTRFTLYTKCPFKKIFTLGLHNASTAA